jgi:protein SCO1/2
MRLPIRFIFAVALACSILPRQARAEATGVIKPAFLDGAGIEQKLGAKIPLDLPFTDSTGKAVKLGDYFNGKQPVLLTLVYYRCPTLCTLVLNDLTRGLNGLDLNPGTDFQVVTVSFDPGDTTEDAADKKSTYLQSYTRPGASENWHFLTGSEASIKALTDAVGFRFKYDPKYQQFIHPTGIMVLTPNGVLSRYFFGIDFGLKDLKLALQEASGNKIGSLTDQLLLYCFHYDPTSGKYSLMVVKLMKVGAAMTMVLLGAFWFVMFRKPAASQTPAGFEVGRKDR